MVSYCCASTRIQSIVDMLGVNLDCSSLLYLSRGTLSYRDVNENLYCYAEQFNASVVVAISVITHLSRSKGMVLDCKQTSFIGSSPVFNPMPEGVTCTNMP